MKGNTVARTLKARLTEEGLKRVIKRSSIYNDRFIAEFSADELERLIQIEPINMSRGGRVIAKKSRRRQNYLARVKKEIHILICTNDKKYATLRRQFTQRKITDRTRHNDRRGHRRLHRVKCCDAHAVCRGCPSDFCRGGDKRVLRRTLRIARQRELNGSKRSLIE